MSVREANQVTIPGLPAVPKVLLAEDDPVLREYCVRALQAAGLVVDAAEDGKAAWALFQQRNYDLLITDNDMPEMTGVELFARVRCLDASTPVILISGSPAASQILERAGFKNWESLLKPFTADHLLASATAAVGQGRVLNQA